MEQPTRGDDVELSSSISSQPACIQAGSLHLSAAVMSEPVKNTDSHSESERSHDEGDPSPSSAVVRHEQLGENENQPDLFGHDMSILLENNTDRTTSTTPASGLSSRSYSPTNDGSEGQYSSLPAHLTRHITMDVPANTPTEGAEAAMMSQMNHCDLPSFHSMEMLEKIRNKKSCYECGEEEISKEASNYPFTPANSYAEGHMNKVAKTCLLPNFMNPDMMERIKEKKAVLENVIFSDQDCDHFSETDPNNVESVVVAGETSVNKDNIKNRSDKKRDVCDTRDCKFDLENKDAQLDTKNTKDTPYDNNDSRFDDRDLDENTMESSIINNENKQTSKPDHDNLELIRLSKDRVVSFDVDDSDNDATHTKLLSPPPNTFAEFSLFKNNDSYMSGKQSALSQEQPSEKIVAFGFDQNNTTSQSDEVAASEGSSEVKVIQQVEDVILVNSGDERLVIWAESEEDAAAKFTDAVIQSAIEEYRQQCKSTENMSTNTAQDSARISCKSMTKTSSEEHRADCIDVNKHIIIDYEPGETSTDDDKLPQHGNNPGEIQTETVNKSKSNVTFVLGDEPGESNMESDAFEEHMRLKGMEIVDVAFNTGELKTESSSSHSILEGTTTTSNTADEHEKANDFVKEVIEEALEVCRKDLDGSTVRCKDCADQSPGGSCGQNEQLQQPEGGGTEKEKLSEEETKVSRMKENKKINKKEQIHLEGVQKALDMDLSIEDEDEIKTLEDQFPEEMSIPNNLPAERPTTLNTTKKKIVPNLDLLNDNDMDIPVSPISTDDDIGISIDDEKTPDDLTTPDVLNNSMFDGELEWQSTSSSTPVDPIPEYTAQEEFEDERHWRSVQIGEKWYKIDMKVIEPYKKVLSHGGYYGDGFNAIVVFTACYLPDRRRRDYRYVMDNLFLYVISTLELLVVEDYMIVYFHGATPRHKMPSLRWLKRCYDMIDRRLRKNLKGLLIVHPTIWLKTLVFMMKPFISSKFSSKLRYIKNLEALTKAVPTEYIYIPEEVKKTDPHYCNGKPCPRHRFINL